MSKTTEKRIFELVNSFYDHARQPSPDGWQGVFLELADIFSSGPGGFLLRNEENTRFNFVAGNTSPEFLREYVEYYQFVNPFRGALKDIPAGESIIRSEVMPDNEYVRTEFYNDFLRRIDAFNFAIHNLANSNGIAAGLVITRPRSRAHFTASEERTMAMLVPHLGRALQVYLNFADVQNEYSTILAALTAMEQCVIVIDKDCKVSFATERAEKRLRAKDGLQIDRNGVLRACSASDDKRLSELLSGILKPKIENIANYGGALQISRPDGSRPLQVRVTPFSAHSFLGTGTEAMAMIFVHDPDLQIETQESVLVQLYGLTKAEARLAAILAQGRSIDEACAILGVTQNTTRTHLKRIFSKTGTHRQSELVRLIVGGLANLRIEKQPPSK